MTAMRSAALVCGLALWSAACSSSPGAIPDAATYDGGLVSCTIVQFFDGGQTATLCLETPPSVAPTLQQSCSAQAMGASADAGTVTFAADGGCSRTDSLGACQTFADGLPQNQWYYGSGGNSPTSVFGQTASDIHTLCTDMSESYIAP
jgi:hypothetical protein